MDKKLSLLAKFIFNFDAGLYAAGGWCEDNPSGVCLAGLSAMCSLSCTISEMLRAAPSGGVKPLLASYTLHQGAVHAFCMLADSPQRDKRCAFCGHLRCPVTVPSDHVLLIYNEFEPFVL